jgi:hypothetical protein
MSINEEKDRFFGYNWARLSSIVIAVPLVGAYIIWRGGGFGLADYIVIPAAFLFLAIRGMLPMCKVILTESEIHISFMLPNQRGGRFRHDEIESYTEIAIDRRGRRILVCGFLQPKTRKKLILSRAGTKGFEELNSILSKMFPNTRETGRQVTEGNLQSGGDNGISQTN